MTEKSVLNKLGRYLLSGALLTGIGYSTADAQDKEPEPRKLIIAKEDLTVADSSRFLVSSYTPLEISENSSYDLTTKLGCQDVIKYRAMKPKEKKDVKTIENDLKKVSNPNLRKQYSLFYEEAKKSKGLAAFNRAISDGKVVNIEVEYLTDGTYFVEIKTPSESVIRIIKVKKGKLEQKVQEEKKTEVVTEKPQLPNQLYEVSAPKPDSSSYKIQEDTSKTKVDSTKVLEKKAVPDSSKIKEQEIQKEKAKQEFLKKVTEAEEKMLERNKKFGREMLKSKSEKADSVKLKDYEENLDLEKKIKKEIKVIVKEEKKAERLCTRFGLEAAVSWAENEANIGSFVEIPLTSWFSVGGYGDYFIRAGKPILSDLGTQITQREKQLISSAKYKQRTDNIHATAEERAVADIGAGFSFKIRNNIEFPLRIGVGLLKHEKTVDGESIITFEENGQLLQEPSVITNTQKESPKTKAALTWSAGVLYNLIGDWLAVGASVNGIGPNKNIGRLNLRVAF